jgi:hypothetical protein
MGPDIPEITITPWTNLAFHYKCLYLSISVLLNISDNLALQKAEDRLDLVSE